MVTIDYRGALGDTICLTAFLPELSRKFNEKIIVNTHWPDVFRENDYVSDIITLAPFGKENALAKKLKSNSLIRFLIDNTRKQLLIRKSSENYLYIDQDYIFHNRHRHFMYSLADQLDLSFTTQIPNIQLSNSEITDIEQVIEDKKNPFIVLSPFAGWKSRLWEKSEFLKIADWLRKNKYKVLEVGGPDDEYQGLGENYVGKLGLREVFALIKKSKLYIGVDSGLYHAAVALQTPSVVIYGPVLAPL